MFAAILRASSHVSSLAADRRPGPPMRVVAGLPGLYQVIDGQSCQCGESAAYFNCGRREQV
jgi:hypothetical protein